MNALWKKRKKGNMTEIKEALFDEEPEKKEEPEKTDPDMEPLFGQEDKIEEAGEENGQTEEPEIESQKKTPKRSRQQIMLLRKPPKEEVLFQIQKEEGERTIG